MTKKIYNKLVRREIPEIIKESGKSCTYVYLNPSVDEEKDIIVRLLKEKLVEEATEVLEAKTNGQVLEELGDLKEVVDNLLSFISNRSFSIESTEKDIKTLMEAKNIKNGPFWHTVDKDGKKTTGIFGGETRYTKLLSVDDDG